MKCRIIQDKGEAYVPQIQRFNLFWVSTWSFCRTNSNMTNQSYGKYTKLYDAKTSLAEFSVKYDKMRKIKNRKKTVVYTGELEGELFVESI